MKKTTAIIGTFILLTATVLLSCGGNQAKQGQNNTASGKENTDSATTPAEGQGQVCWKGTLDSRTNVLLHYQIADKVLVGEIIYLDTKERKPIKVIGTIEEGEDWREYRLLEFEESGNITGIITGLPTEDEFTGSWFSPKTRKDLTMDLKRVDTLIKPADIGAKADAIAGKYYYQYGKGGGHGELEVSRVDDRRVAFSALAVTESGNMASSGSLAESTAEKDTVSLDGNSFVYQVDECEFRVTFFRDFAHISYTGNSDCAYTFGRNATLEGIFVKKKQ